MSKRAFRTWDVDFLYEVGEHAAQFVAKIDEAITEETDLNEVPASLVPTSMLYNLAAAYQMLLDKAQSEDLIKAGSYHKLPKQLH
jgi:hypothetical protein